MVAYSKNLENAHNERREQELNTQKWREKYENAFEMASLHVDEENRAYLEEYRQRFFAILDREDEYIINDPIVKTAIDESNEEVFSWLSWSIDNSWIRKIRVAITDVSKNPRKYRSANNVDYSPKDLDQAA